MSLPDFDRDPEALAWARAKVQHEIDRMVSFERQAAETGTTDPAQWRRFSGMLRRSFIGGEGCVIAAFDERLPRLGGEAMSLPDFPVDNTYTIHVPEGWEKLPRSEFVGRMLVHTLDRIEEEAREDPTQSFVSALAAHVLAYADWWQGRQETR